MVPHYHRADVRLFASFLLSPFDRLFVTALLAPQERARNAWLLWTQQSHDWTDARLPHGRLARSFAPLLLEAIAHECLTADRTAVAKLRAWRLTEAERNTRYYAMLRDIVTGLSADHQMLLLDGPALAVSVYREPVHRHCHDVELLVRAAHVESVATRLGSEGFVRAPVSGPRCMALIHDCGLRLLLHTALFPTGSGDATGFDDVYAAREAIVIAGSTTATVSRAHALAHACGPALTVHGPIEAVRRLIDVWHLAACNPPLDWHLLIRSASDHQLVLPIALALSWLQEECAMPFPRSAMQTLEAAAAGQLVKEAASLLPVLAGSPRSVRTLVGLPVSWSAKLSLGFTMLVPPVEHVRRSDETTTGIRLAGRYVRRVARWLDRRPAST